MSVEYYERYWSTSGLCPDGANEGTAGRLMAAHVPAGSKCLDFGCGSGRSAGIWLREHGMGYVGVDVSASAVAMARALGLQAIQIDDGVLPFEDRAFDVAVAFEVFEHLFEPQRGARELRRVLRPGGLLLTTVPNIAHVRRRIESVRGCWNPFGDELSTEQPWRDPHIRFFNARSFRAMLEASGFVVERVGGHEGRLMALAQRWSLGERLHPLLGLRLHAVARRPAG